MRRKSKAGIDGVNFELVLFGVEKAQKVQSSKALYRHDKRVSPILLVWICN